jgi:hypothetical protein
MAPNDLATIGGALNGEALAQLMAREMIGH